ncbi:multidrug effflux MFS transporter [Streptomyces sp. I05A-00742]|uniref:multidrug effflux MFS transporter n=1 Tax=Streptomyces sp. I05A-00742 TaxID=2732853 RepID=UPI001488711E|nr:multidrug effflux MFS transporter [Streptomyces sp. I05A-00742]
MRVPRLLTAALVLLSFVMPLATDMYLPAFPRMTDDLHTDASGVQLTLTSFLVGMGLGQLVLGPLSDRLGRRLPLLTGGAVCVAATVLCAMAPSLGWLVALRFAQGFSGAAGVVIGRAVVSDVAEGRTAARMFGILMTLMGIAPVLAPVAGGAVVGHGGWHGVFWVLAGACLLALVAAVVAVPESLPVEKRHTGGGAATLRAAREVLGDRPYLGYTLAFGFSLAVLFCYVAGASFLFQNVLGFGLGQTSAAFASVGVVSTLASTVITKLVGRFTAGGMLRAGLRLMFPTAVALCLATVAGGLTAPVALVLLGLLFVPICLVTINAVPLALARVPRAAGTGSAVLGALQSALSALAAPLVGLGGQDTALPMFLCMTGFAGLALLALRLTRHATGPAEPAGAPAA